MEKLGCCLIQIWWAIMVILTVSCITFEISSLAIPRWFTQGTGLYTWEGGILTPYPSSTWYKDKACDRDFHRNGYCDMFDNLWKAGIVYIVFEAFSILTFFICIVLYIVEMAKSRKLVLWIMILQWVAVGAHFIGFVTWAAMGRMKYQGICEEFYTRNGDKPASICRKEGATMALFIMLYIPIIAMLQTVLWYQNRERLVEEPEHEYKSPSDHPEVSSREEHSEEHSSREVVSDSGS